VCVAVLVRFIFTVRFVCLQGLRRREEVFGQKIMWFYTRRPNFLVYRSATLGECVGPPPDVGALNPAGASSGMGGPAAAGAVAGSRRATERSAAAMDSSRTVDTDAGVFVVRKMAEKYDRNPAKPAHNDICKMSYFMSEGTIQVRYHFVDGHITQNTRLYHNDKADGQMDMLTRDETTPIPKVNMQACCLQQRAACSLLSFFFPRSRLRWKWTTKPP